MTPPKPSRSTVDPLVAYYLATPVFAVADLLMGLSVRVVGLEEPLHRGAYYLGAFLCGLLCRARPGLTPWVGMLESSGNLLLLLLSVLLPIWSLPDAFMAGGPVEAPLGIRGLTNVAVSGSALIWAFQRHQRRATAATTAGGGRDGSRADGEEPWVTR